LSSVPRFAIIHAPAGRREPRLRMAPLSEDLFHNCGVAALYWLDAPPAASVVGRRRPRKRNGPAADANVRGGNVTPLMPMILLDLQNRGQLAAGLSSYHPGRDQRLDTFKDVGTVAEAFRMSHPAKHQAVLEEYAGRAVVGHTRYATCGLDDARYAQPFERHHGRLWKWFAFGFNGQIANYTEYRDRLKARRHYHFTLKTDTEILMHALAYHLRGDAVPDLSRVMAALSRSLDGAYNLVFLDAMGRMFAARDPLGFRPLSWAVEGRLLGIASESVALSNAGFRDIRDIPAGEMAVVEDGRLRFERFAGKKTHAHCFFEWVYFSNVGSTIADTSVYIARARSGERLAEAEDQTLDKSCIVVPVPDTAKAAADAYAFALGLPCLEGLLRNRYIGRTFIQPSTTRGRSAKGKYTPLPAILAGKRVFLIEDSIVRSTTLRALAGMIRTRGRAKEVHVRVACPPIVAPCFYGIDMSTLGELFAPKLVRRGYDGVPTPATLKRMAGELDLDSLKYLAVPDLGRCLNIDNRHLCLGCVTGKYPTPWGNKLIAKARRGRNAGRTYE